MKSTYSPVKTAVLGALIGIFVLPLAIFAYERLVTPCMIEARAERSFVAKVIEFIYPVAFACGGGASGSWDPPNPFIPTCPEVPNGFQPRDPGLPSGALCRGACGPDCNGWSCLPNPIYQPHTLCVQDAAGGVHRTCSYPYITCGSHPACVTHDNCYDGCATQPDPVTCRRGCDLACTDTYGLELCTQWSQGLGPQPNSIRFSYPPVSWPLSPGPCP